MDYTSIFDAAVSGKPSAVPETDYKELFENVLGSAFPVAKTVKEAYDVVEPAVRPVVNSPITGVGGLIDLAQGNSVQDAAQGIQAGKTAGNYVADAIPDTQTGTWLDKANQFGKTGLGALTDLGIMSGPIEAVSGDSVTPKWKVNLDPSAPVESPALPDPIKTNAIDTQLVDTFNEAVSGKPKDYGQIFEDAVKPEPKPEVPVETPKVSQDVAPSAETNLVNAPKEDLPVINPRTLERTKPYALYIGEQDYGEGNTVSLYNIHGSEYKTPGTTASLETIQKENIPVLGKEPPRPSAAEMSRMFREMKDEKPETDITPSSDAKPAEIPAIKPSGLNETGAISFPNGEDFRTLGRTLAEKMDTTGSYDVIDNLKAGRRGYIQEANFRDAITIDKALEGLSPDERKAMVFSEKWRVPTKYEADPTRASIVNLIKNPTPAMLKAREDIHPWFEKSYQQAKTLDPNMHHREDYIPNMYKQPTVAGQETNGVFSTRAGFTNERVLDNPAIGIDAGLALKHEDAGDLFKAYAKTKNRAVLNVVFRNALKNIQDKDIIRPSKDAPVTWKHIPNAAFAGYSVNPEHYDKLKFLKGTPESTIVGKLYDTVSAAMKKSLFFGGGFHGVTMGESSVEANGLKAFGLPKALLDSIKHGGASLVDPEWTARMLRANLNIVHPSDIETAYIEKLSNKIDDVLNTNLAEAPGIKQLSGIEKGMDKALWTHEQGVLKLYTARVLTEWADQNMTDTPQFMRDRHVAEIVNDLYGSQSWDLLFDNPQWQKWLTRITMAPDYWGSTLRSFVKNAYPGVQGHAARSFSTRGWIGMLGLVGLANYGMTKLILGKGEFPWSKGMEDERGVGHVLLWKFKEGRYKGRRLYVNFGKAFMEPYKLMQHPVKVLRGKANPLANLIHSLITGHSLSGYDLQLERPGNTLSQVGQAFNPIQFSGSSLGGTFPLTMGFSYPRLEEGLKEAIWNAELAKQAGDTKTLNKALEQRKWVIQEAKMNGLKYGFVENQVRSKIQAQLRSERKYGSEGLQGAYIREATGFKMSNISDAASRELQSLRDRLKNNAK